MLGANQSRATRLTVPEQAVNPDLRETGTPTKVQIFKSKVSNVSRTSKVSRSRTFKMGSGENHTVE